MSFLVTSQARKISGWATLYLGALSLGLICASVLRSSEVVSSGAGVEARLLPAHMRGETLWKTISAKEIHAGATIPAHTNVIINVPEDITRITRRVLFGYAGMNTRYWGYCFPETYEEAAYLRRIGLPGKIFLSEKEREYMLNRIREQRRGNFSIFEDLDEKTLNEQYRITGTVRHQKEIFGQGDTCYVMTEEPISIGSDRDNDNANSKIEKMNQSDPLKQDTDGDGVHDGQEIFRLGTMVTVRDTDADGLIDGVEDANHNGRLDPGETSPTRWDSDGDGLCDGYCIVTLGIRTGFSAPKGYQPSLREKIFYEDKNLNGKVDGDETDPRKKDTDGDGIFDDQEFLTCQVPDAPSCSDS